MYSQRSSPESVYTGMSPRGPPSHSSWQHRPSMRSQTPQSIPESIFEGVPTTPDIETDLPIHPEDLAPPYRPAGQYPMHYPPQQRVGPRPPHHEPHFQHHEPSLPMADAETQNAAAVIIQKAFRAKAAFRASHVAHRLRRKAQRRAGAEARKTVDPQSMGADYSLVGAGRNLKWLFEDRGATISSLKGNDVSEMRIGDHLVAVNDVIVDNMLKEEIKLIWKREHGASEYTTLYFRRGQNQNAPSPSPFSNH